MLCKGAEKATEHSRSAASAPGFKNRLLMNVPRPGVYKLAPRSRGGESKNAVPSKKPNRCCGADTDMSERARAYSKVHSKIDRAASRERSLISPSAMLNVYLNAKKAARLRVPRLPEGPSQVQTCHTTSPVRALVFSCSRTLSNIDCTTEASCTARAVPRAA